MLSVLLRPRVVTDAPARFALIARRSVTTIFRPHGHFTCGKAFNRTLLVTKDRKGVKTTLLSTGTYLEDKTNLLAIRVPKHNRRVLRATFPRTVISLSRRRSRFDSISNVGTCSSVTVKPNLKRRPSSIGTLRRLLRMMRGPLIVSTSTLGLVTTGGSLLGHVPPHDVLAPRPGRFSQVTNRDAGSCRQLGGTRTFTASRRLYIILGKTCATVYATAKGICFGGYKGPNVTATNDNSILANVVLTLLTRKLRPRATTISNIFLRKATNSLTTICHSRRDVVTDSVASVLKGTFGRVGWGSPVGLARWKKRVRFTPRDVPLHFREEL